MSVTAPAGFAASGAACGIKTGGALDLALVVARPPALAAGSAARAVPVAAVFTSNRAAAAPVQLSRAHLAATGGMAAAVVLNSGCANAATGESGMEAAVRTSAAVAAALGVRPEEVLVCSTGLIGPPLPVERVELAVPDLAGALGDRPLDGSLAARAIMTTDTHPKEAVARRDGWSVGGMVKGAGMIAPDLVAVEPAAATAGGPPHATMLCVLTTDVSAGPDQLAEALAAAVDVSFNALTVDGCTSTNDTVILLASGAAGPVGTEELTAAVTEVCEELAAEMALDAEGTTKVARIAVTGAASDADARLAARGVAESLLVKTSLFGADPYWGRVVSELGASGAAFDLSRVRVGYGGIVVCEGGVAAPHDEGAVARHLTGRVVEIGCALGLGEGSALVVTTDLGHGYINENMHTS